MNIPIVIILGTPRSGTSLLGRILDRHPRISTWVEPYYIWEHHYRESPHDEMNEDDATDEVRVWIRRAFNQYWKAFKVDLVVDKSPRNSLKIPFVKSIFPEARYILLLRDGRDTILSIKKQWEGKKELFGKTEKMGQWRERLQVVKRWLGRRPLWRFRLQSILFELGPSRNWLKKKFLSQIRWGGRFGWGPRFKGWQEIMDRTTTLEFSAYQWVHCARGIIDNIDLLPENRCFILKYEDFIKNPKTSVEKLLSFLDVGTLEGIMDRIPEIWADNSNKWRRAFSLEELNAIGPIIGRAMIDLGYEKDESWYQDGK